MAKNETTGHVDKDAISPDVANGPPLPMDDWPDYPLLLCANSRHKYFHTNHDDQVAIPINTVFELESKSFKGQGIIRMADTPTCDKKYFKGRRRKSAITTQGVFKRRIRFDHVFTGQLFDRPFRNVPTQYLISTGLKIVKTLAPSLKADIDSDTPHLMSPWASACQIFNICKKGDEIPLPAETTENVEILGAKFKGMPFSQRKTLFHDPKELEKYYFEPDYVYTMSFYSHMFSPMTYSLHMLKMKWGIQSYIPAPMQINAIILPESQNVNNIADSYNDIIGDTTINDKLINEILKEKSASVEVGQLTAQNVEKNNNKNSDNNNNNKNKNDDKNDNKNDDKNKNNTVDKGDNGDNDSSSSIDDVPKTGRDRNPAVDSAKEMVQEQKEREKAREQEKQRQQQQQQQLQQQQLQIQEKNNTTQENNNKNNNTENNANSNNNNSNENNNDDDSDSDHDEKKEAQIAAAVKSMSEMTIDEKYEAINTNKDFHLLDCEMIYSFNVWHVKLVDELYNGKYSLAQKNKNKGKGDSSFSLFSKKKSADDAQMLNVENTNTSSGSKSFDSGLNNNNDDSSQGDKNRKGSITFGLFGKKW